MILSNLLGLLIGIAANAQELDTVRVNTNKATRQSFKSSVPLQILSDSALQRLNSFSVADAMRYFAGVQLKDYGGIGGLKTVNVRSLGASYTGVFYNGNPIGNVQNGQVDLGKFSLDNMEEIALYNAGSTQMPQPAMAYAAGSAIYLKSKNPIFNKRESTYIKASFKTGSFGLVNPSILWQQRIAENYSLSVSGETVNADGKYKFHSTANGYDTTAIRENADIHSQRIEAAIAGHLRDSTQWNTQLYYYHSERGLPGAIVSNVFYNAQRLWDKNFFAQSTFQKRFSNLYQLLLTGKYAYDYTRYADPDRIGTNGELQNAYRSKDFYVSAANQFSLRRFWKILFSVDARRNILNADIYSFAFPSRNTLLGLLATDFSWDRLQVQGNVLSSYTWDKVQSGTAQPNRKIYSPAVAASWQPFWFKGFRLRGFYKDIFRLPTFNDIYYTDYASINNINLKPEYARQADLGFTFLKNINPRLLVSMQTDAYYNHIKNKIIAMPSANLFRWRMVNLDKVSIHGINTQLKSTYNWSGELKTNISLQYTWEKALNKTIGSTYNNPVPYAPVNSGSVIFNADYKSWGLDYSFIYTGERYNIADISLINSYMLPWYTHDMAINKAINIYRYKVKIAAEANNIFNQQYEVVRNYPMPGRSVRFLLNIQF